MLLKTSTRMSIEGRRSIHIIKVLGKMSGWERWLEKFCSKVNERGMKTAGRKYVYSESR